MKLGIVLSSQPSSFSAIPFKEGIAENVSKISKLGFDGVEMAVRNPEQLNVEWLASLIREHHMTVPAIQTGQVYLEEGLCFIHADPVIRSRAVDRIRAHVRLAGALGAKVIIGLVRGKKTGEIRHEDAETWLIEALRECAREDSAVELVIEPINRYETDVINTVGSGMELMTKVKMDNVGLLLDTFHMNIEEPSISGSILMARERLFHFHIADSNRWHPGAGHIDFPGILDTLDQIGYGGFLTAEILPMPDPDTSAVKTIEYMRKLRVPGN